MSGAIKETTNPNEPAVSETDRSVAKKIALMGTNVTQTQDQRQGLSMLSLSQNIVLIHASHSLLVLRIDLLNLPT